VNAHIVLVPLQAVAEMQAKGKPQVEIDAFSKLFSECQRQIDSKQLRPVIRTQYMRTAFQIPFDATVRISLDTNLVMIKEGVDEGEGIPLHRWCFAMPLMHAHLMFAASSVSRVLNLRGTKGLPASCSIISLRSLVAFSTVSVILFGQLAKRPTF
jgi:hypothetical protein